MGLMLNQATIRAIAKEVVAMLDERHKPKLVTTEEAARMLGISASRVRQIKDRLDYVKNGDNMQGRLMFNAETLIDNYNRMD